jgi:hypothetical protein
MPTDNEVSKIVSPTDLTLTELTNAAKLTSSAGTILAASVEIIKWITIKKPVPFTNDPKNENYQDLRRYNTLCNLYKSHLVKSALPVNWKLNDNNCPTAHAELVGCTEWFKQKYNNVRGSEIQLKHGIIQIIASIEKLFDSIKKRSYSFVDYKKHRPDGFETMFYAELVDWLTSDLASAKVKNQETADMIQRRIDYCTAVKKSVFFFRGDDKKHNPLQNLDRIITNLKLHHADVCKSIQAASFNDHIEQVSDNLLDMGVNMLQISYLILKNVNQNDLQVDEFLNPNPKVDQKVMSLAQTIQGEWIKATLNKLGIIGNNFQSTKDIDLEMITNHLNMDVNQMDLSKTGLPDFILNNKKCKIKTEKDQFARNVLRKIINLHREILNVYYVRTSLVNASRVSIELGQTRLYGHEDGKMLVRGLLFIIKDASIQAEKAAQELWSLFYEDTYIPYADFKGISNTDPTYKFLTDADIRFNHISTCKKKITATIEKVATNVKLYENDVESIQQREHKLICDIYGQLCRRECPDKELFGAIKKIAETHVSASPAVLKAIQPKIEPYVVQFPLSKMPLYLLAKELFANNSDCPQNFSLMPEPTHPYSTLHKQLYIHFLNHYNPAVNAGGFTSFFRRIFGYRLSVLRDFYSRLNALMMAIYSQSTSARLRVQENITPKTSKPFVQLGNGVVTCWETELMLINQCIKEALFSFTEQMNALPLNILTTSNDFETLHVQTVGKNLVVSIDRRLLNYAGATFAKELADTRQELVVSQKELTKEKADHDLTRKDLVKCNYEIDKLNILLAEKNKGQVEKDNELISQRKKEEELSPTDVTNNTVVAKSTEMSAPSTNNVVFFGKPTQNLPSSHDKIKVSCACFK